MTVAELIEKLQQLPADLPVKITGYGSIHYTDVSDVWTNGEEVFMEDYA